MYQERTIEYEKIKDHTFKEISVLTLILEINEKGIERYIFVYHDEHIEEIQKTLGRYAANPELSFSWYDAACLSQRIRREKYNLDLEKINRRF